MDIDTDCTALSAVFSVAQCGTYSLGVRDRREGRRGLGLQLGDCGSRSGSGILEFRELEGL